MNECVVLQVQNSAYLFYSDQGHTAKQCVLGTLHSCYRSHPKTYCAVIKGVMPEATVTVKITYQI